MGLFSSKTVTTVGTEVARVIEDSRIPNSIANGIAKNLFANDDQLVEYALEEMSNSIGLRAHQMLTYGRKKYAYGLPKSTIKTSAAGRDAAEAAIEAQVGAQVNMLYYHFGAYNNLHYGWQQLVDVYGYDSGTNTLASLSQQKGTAVYLKDLQVVVTNATLEELDNGSMDQWGVPANAGYTPERSTLDIIKVAKPTPFAVDPLASGDYVRADICWEVSETYDTGQKDVNGAAIMATRTVLKTDSFQIPVSGLDPIADYHQASYILAGRTYFWTYQANTGTNPAIDAVFNTAYATGGTFFPFVYFRYNKTAATADENSDWFKQSHAMVDKIGMDFKAIATAIDQNPDIKDVEQAMMMMAVPANSTNALDQRYLFDFFAGVYQKAVTSPGATGEDLPWLSKLRDFSGQASQETSIIIQDARFKMALSYRQVVYRRRAGSIGKVGTYSGGRNTSQSIQDVPVVNGGTQAWPTNTDVHWYRHQITETLYEEYLVYGLKTTFWVFEQYTTIGDEDDKILLIPVDEAISRHYSIPDKEALYSRSLQYVFNSRVQTKLKWYQQGWFATLLTIAAIVISVLSMQPEIYALAADIVTIIAVGSTVALVMATALLLVEQLVIAASVKLFVKKIGAKAALIAAVIAAIVGAYQYLAETKLPVVPDGKAMLAASSTLSSAANKQMQFDMQDLVKSWQDFNDYVKEQTRLLDDAEKLLDVSQHVSPLVIFGESPQSFYQRTVHSGNIGVLAIDAVSSYVDMALQLPKLSDTLGGYV